MAGESLLLASIHRAIKPGSKRAFAEFAGQTTLQKIAGFNPDRLDSQQAFFPQDSFFMISNSYHN